MQIRRARREILAHINAVRRNLQEIMTDLITFNGSDLVAKRILWMLDAGRFDGNNPLMASQYDLAMSMGLSVPTVQRAFRQMQSAGILDTDYGMFRVIDRDKLQALVNSTTD